MGVSVERTRGELLSIVVPVYDEEASIPALVERLASLADKLVDRDGGEVGVGEVEVILVDDHSRDRTPELLRAACDRHPSWRYLRLAHNRGSHVAILAGLEHARGDCAVFLAADLQDPPELIGELLARWRSGDQVVWAVRERRPGEPLLNRLTSAIFYRLLNRLGEVEMPPRGSDFALLDRRVVDALLAAAGAHPSLGGEIARLGFRHSEVPYVKAARKAGSSKWTLGRKLTAFADALVAFSAAPLRWMIYLGLLLAAAGVIYAFAAVMRAALPGWRAVLAAVLVVGGAQMMMLGVLGEYLWRMLGEARKRPRHDLEELYPANLRDAPDVVRGAPRVAGNAARARDPRRAGEKQTPGDLLPGARSGDQRGALDPGPQPGRS